MQSNTKQRWYFIFYIVCIMLICSSIPFDLLIKNDLIVYILNIILKVGFIIYYFYYVKKEKLAKLEFNKLNKKSLLFLPFLLICVSNFIVVIYNKVNLNENISYIVILKDVLSCILIAICEEIVFRGLLFKEFLNKQNVIKAMIYSSLVFGGVHLLNISSLDNILYCLIQSVYSFGLGLILSFIYYYSKNIILPIFLHFSFNFINDSLVSNLFNLNWNISFYIINIIVATIVALYALFMYFKFKEVK